jgi:hypothetical protein
MLEGRLRGACAAYLAKLKRGFVGSDEDNEIWLPSTHHFIHEPLLPTNASNTLQTFPSFHFGAIIGKREGKP